MCRTLPRKEVRRVMHSAGPVFWYEHEAWNEGEETCWGWGRSTTFITPVYPYLASCSQKVPACRGANPHRW